MKIRLAALVVAVASATLACGARYAHVPVLDDGTLHVRLRAEVRAGEPVPRGFAHPAVIAGVRIAHILSRLDAREGAGADRERKPAVPTDLLHPVGEAVSKALGRATPDQEVVVQVIRTQRRLGVFTEKRVSGFVAWVEGEDLVLHFTHVDWALPKGPDEKIPEPFAGKASARLRLLPGGESMTPRGPTGVAVHWRDPVFRDPSHLRVEPGGRVLRRTILLESPAEAGAAAPEEAPVALPAGLSPETLRELADLEEARRAGALTEAEYDARRRRLLEGRDAPGP